MTTTLTNQIPFRRAADGVYEITAVDLFCGAGGTSTGLVEAVEEIEKVYGIKIRLKIVAVNHWPVAIETHSANHNFAQHHCSGLTGVDPMAVIPGPLDLLVASPECTHHSNARGGKPMDDQSRSSGDDVVRWIKLKRPGMVLVENVREYRGWGPLIKTRKGLRPDPKRKGEYFQRFLAQIRELGYSTDDRLLCAADYGDPTSRVRLFVLCRRGGGTIAWPAQTHAKDPEKLLVPGLKPWRAARELIDWNDRGQSIFNRKKPLKPNTMRRIAAGLKKFSGIDIEEYLVKLYGTSTAASAKDPVPTVTGGGNHLYIVQPFVLGQQSGSVPRSTDEPLPTIATGGALSKIEPYMVQYNGTADAKPVDQPVPAIPTKDRFGVAKPFIVAHFGEHEGQQPRTHDIDAPAPTVTQRGMGDLAVPFIAEYHSTQSEGGERVRPTSEPLPTQDCANRFGLAQPFMMSAGGPECAPRSTEEPAHTVLTRDHIAVVKPEAFTVPVTHQDAPGADAGARVRSTEEPLQAVTGAHRGEIGLAQPFAEALDGATVANRKVVGVEMVKYTHNVLQMAPQNGLLITFEDGTRWLLDIFFRMFKPRELARAQSFPDSYVFKGSTSDIVKQVGNAVPVKLAKALCINALTQLTPLDWWTA